MEQEMVTEDICVDVKNVKNGNMIHDCKSLSPRDL